MNKKILLLSGFLSATLLSPAFADTQAPAGSPQTYSTTSATVAPTTSTGNFFAPRTDRICD